MSNCREEFLAIFILLYDYSSDHPEIKLGVAARWDVRQRVGEGWEWKERENERAGEGGGRRNFFWVRSWGETGACRLRREPGWKFWVRSWGEKWGMARGEGVWRSDKREICEREEMGVSSWVEEEFEASVQVRFLHVLHTSFQLALFLVNFGSCLVLIIWIARHMMR